MKTKISVLTVGLLVLLGLFNSCKKDNNNQNPEPEPPDCKIATITQKSSSSSDASIYNLYYNNDGKLSKIEDVTGFLTKYIFTYAGNKINVTTVDSSGTTTAKKVVTLNNDEKIEAIEITYQPSGTIATYDYEYDGSGNLIKSTYIYDTDPPSTTLYQSANGNITTISYPSSSTTNTLEYYEDTEWQAGDYFQITQFFSNGAYYVKNKNVLKSLTDGSDIANINYDYDTDGKITKLTLIQGSTETTLEYQWSCE